MTVISIGNPVETIFPGSEEDERLQLYGMRGVRRESVHKRFPIRKYLKEAARTLIKQ